MTIGETIKKYRKEAGMTQEEVANMLGVTAPAVNKWEKNKAYPDISLLPPIARLFGITVDELITYEEHISKKQLLLFLGRLLGLLRKEKIDTADVITLIQKKIDEYPSDFSFISIMATLLESFDKKIEFKDGKENERIQEYLLTLYQRCLKSTERGIVEWAADHLFMAAIEKERYDEAEEFLDTYLKDFPKKKLREARLYRKKGDVDKAFELYEENLFFECKDVVDSLMILEDLYEEMKDNEKTEEISRLRKEFTALMGLSSVEETRSQIRDLKVIEIEEENGDEVKPMTVNKTDFADYYASPLFQHYDTIVELLIGFGDERDNKRGKLGGDLKSLTEDEAKLLSQLKRAKR